MNWIIYISSIALQATIGYLVEEVKLNFLIIYKYF